MLGSSMRDGGAAGAPSLVRRGLLLAAAVLMLVAALAACGGDDDNDRGVTPVMSTFTPTPPNWTPEIVQTRSARETEFAQTQTAQPNVTSTPPPSVSPAIQTPIDATPRETARPGEIRPPDAVLRSPSGDLFGIIGDSNFVDPVTGTGAQIDAPYVPLEGAVRWQAGVAALIEIPNSPYAVRSAVVDIFNYDANVALPQTEGGIPTGEIAFFPQTPPDETFNLAGATLSVTHNRPPGNYIVAVRINWDAIPTDIGEQFTQYVYVIQVD